MDNGIPQVWCRCHLPLLTAATCPPTQPNRTFLSSVVLPLACRNPRCPPFPGQDCNFTGANVSFCLDSERYPGLWEVPIYEMEASVGPPRPAAPAGRAAPLGGRARTPAAHAARDCCLPACLQCKQELPLTPGPPQNSTGGFLGVADYTLTDPYTVFKNQLDARLAGNRTPMTVRQGPGQGGPGRSLTTNSLPWLEGGRRLHARNLSRLPCPALRTALHWSG